MRLSTKCIMLAVLPLLAACAETQPDNGSANSGNEINVSIGTSTKNIITGNENGVQLAFYGYASGTPVIEGDYIKHPQASADGSWDIFDDSNAKVQYFWSNDADYTFFSWLASDGTTASSDFFGTGYGYADGILTVPAKNLGISTGLDFCYSGIVNRPASERDYSTVDIELQHLFAAFSMSAKNYSNEDIMIKHVILHGLKDGKGATINYNATDADGVAVYGTGSVTNPDLITSSISIASGASKASIVNGGADATTHFLVWPQTKADLATTGYTDSEHQPTGGAYLEVVYTQNGGADITRYARIPQDELDGWPAGVRQNMEISISDKLMYLTVSALPWNQTTPDYDYEGAAFVLSPLSFVTDSERIVDGKNVYFKPGYPILLEFKIGAPLNASWMVAKLGDFDAFEIDNVTPGTGTGVIGDGIDTKEGLIDGEMARIAIYPKIENPKKDYKIQLSFTVRGSNGTVMDINGSDGILGVQGDDGDKSNWYSFIILK